MSFLSTTLLSYGLLVPLSTLCLRMFMDAISFGQFCRHKISRIQALITINKHLLRNSLSQIEQHQYQLSHRDKNIYGINIKTKEALLLCGNVLKLIQGNIGQMKYATITFNPVRIKGIQDSNKAVTLFY
ncbi:hypothetical protein AKO1_008736 [Acrasis kona]|uniref:Uncharacterized protein n=1 Tax=Acrasis kona TaxID=1008807 RepID=A0AAW2ZDY4_9EUKA